MAKLEFLHNSGEGPKRMALEISPDIQNTLRLLNKTVKSLDEYKGKCRSQLIDLITCSVVLCIKDAKLSFKSMDFGTSLRYTGQVNMVPVYNTDDGSGTQKNRVA